MKSYMIDDWLWEIKEERPMTLQERFRHKIDQLREDRDSDARDISVLDRASLAVTDNPWIEDVLRAERLAPRRVTGSESMNIWTAR